MAITKLTKMEQLRRLHTGKSPAGTVGQQKLANLERRGILSLRLTSEEKTAKSALHATQLELETTRFELARRINALLPIGSDQVRGATLNMVVTQSPSVEKPYEFEARLPGGRVVPVVVSENLWPRQSPNLREGTSSVPIVLEKPADARATNARAVTAATIGQVGMMLIGRGELHPPSQKYPSGVFLMGEVQASGSRPGEHRFHDPKFWETQGVAFAFDHLKRLFPALVKEGRNGELTLVRAPSASDWKTYQTEFDIQNRRRDVGNRAHADVGAYSRVIFDLMAAYQMTGDAALLEAARHGIQAQREVFQLRGGEKGAPANLRPGEILWKSNERTLGSQVNDDVVGSVHAVPAYLQAYSLAGISEYFAVTHDPKALEDIVGTLKTWQHHFKNPEFGWYRVIHPETLSGRDESLGDLKDFVAWNSVGDLDVAALFKLHAALGTPRPGEPKLIAEARALAEQISFEASQVITERMYDENSPLLQELFRGETGERVHDWRWQKGHGVVGHNFKVAWNLIRFADHFETVAAAARTKGDLAAAAGYLAQAKRCEEIAFKVWEKISRLGIDDLTAAAKDVLTREPEEGLMPGSPWLPTRDFWHQEQVLLAALKLASRKPNDPQYVEMANRLSLVWCMGFLDTDRQSPNFRTTDQLYKIVEGTYGDRGRADLGYHQGELAMLARAYYRLYVTRQPVDLHLNLGKTRTFNEVSVRPDVVQPGRFELGAVLLNGKPFTPTQSERSSLQFTVPAEYNGVEVHVQATIQPAGLDEAEWSKFAESSRAPMNPKTLQSVFALR